jgi:DNA-binding protein HU-beta
VNKTNMVMELSNRTGLSNRTAKDVLDHVLDIFYDELVEGGEVLLKDIGVLYAIRKAEHKARNPKTGESVTVPERTVVRMRPSTVLSKAVLDVVPTNGKTR